MASGPQQPADTNSSGQAAVAPPPTQEAAGESPSTTEKEKKTPESAAHANDAGSPIPGSASILKKHRKHTAPASNSGPKRVIVREGGASEPAAQIVPGMTPAEAARQRQNAERLLGSTGDQLKHLSGHSLNAPQQETVGQIQNYMDGARTALKEGDVQRASTLAEKAHLLADDLAKH
jgi:hypothetical protein